MVYSSSPFIPVTPCIFRPPRRESRSREKNRPPPPLPPPSSSLDGAAVSKLSDLVAEPNLSNLRRRKREMTPSRQRRRGIYQTTRRRRRRRNKRKEEDGSPVSGIEMPRHQRHFPAIQCSFGNLKRSTFLLWNFSGIFFLLGVAENWGWI